MSPMKPILILVTLALLALPRATAAQVTTIGGKVVPGGATVPVKVDSAGTVQTSGNAALTVGGAAVTLANPVPMAPVAAGAAISTANPLPTSPLAAKALAPAAGAPAARVSISAVSAAATGLTAGVIYRVACSTDNFFRVGAGTPVAVVTDATFFGPGTEYLTLPTGSTGVAFITTAAAGFCTITALSIP